MAWVHSIMFSLLHLWVLREKCQLCQFTWRQVHLGVGAQRPFMMTQVLECSLVLKTGPPATVSKSHLMQVPDISQPTRHRPAQPRHQGGSLSSRKRVHLKGRCSAPLLTPPLPNCLVPCWSGNKLWMVLIFLYLRVCFMVQNPSPSGWISHVFYCCWVECSVNANQVKLMMMFSKCSVLSLTFCLLGEGCDAPDVSALLGGCSLQPPNQMLIWVLLRTDFADVTTDPNQLNCSRGDDSGWALT